MIKHKQINHYFDMRASLDSVVIRGIASSDHAPIVRLYVEFKLYNRLGVLNTTRWFIASFADSEDFDD